MLIRHYFLLLLAVAATCQASVLKITDNPYQYAVYYYDEESKDYYLNARTYDPQINHFIERDSFDELNKQNPFDNRYNYGAGNPVGNTDPSGHCIFDKSMISDIISKNASNDGEVGLSNFMKGLLGINAEITTVAEPVTLMTEQLDALIQLSNPEKDQLTIAINTIKIDNLMPVSYGDLTKPSQFNFSKYKNPENAGYLLSYFKKQKPVVSRFRAIEDGESVFYPLRRKEFDLKNYLFKFNKDRLIVNLQTYTTSLDKEILVTNTPRTLPGSFILDSKQGILTPIKVIKPAVFLKKGENLFSFEWTLGESSELESL